MSKPETCTGTLDPTPILQLIRETAAGESATSLIAMLEATSSEEGCTVFEHTPEEIGIEVMENHKAVLACPRAALAPKDQPHD